MLIILQLVLIKFRCVAEKQCNIFEGKWIENHSEPLYQNETCPFLSQGQNCPGNGRSDSGYLNWKWKPTECELTRFDGLAFLELMRGKTLAFIGDSVTRNQYEALMCMLLQVILSTLTCLTCHIRIQIPFKFCKNSPVIFISPFLSFCLSLSR